MNFTGKIFQKIITRLVCIRCQSKFYAILVINIGFNIKIHVGIINVKRICKKKTLLSDELYQIKLKKKSGRTF